MAPRKAAQTEESKDSSKAHVMDKHGRIARTYTKEIHGDEFVALAKEFAATNGHPSVVEE